MALTGGKQHRRILFASTILIVAVTAAAVVLVLLRANSSVDRGVEDHASDRPSAGPAVDGDWSRRPAELFLARGTVVAASEARWMFATDSGKSRQARYSIKGAKGQLVGEDFVSDFDACARTGSGVLGCQIDKNFYSVDLSTGSRILRSSGLSAFGSPDSPVALTDGWLVAANGFARIISESGQVRWSVPPDEVFSGDSASTSPAPFVVTTVAADGSSRVRAVGNGDLLAECRACSISVHADGFTTTTKSGTTIYTADGRPTAVLKTREMIMTGGNETLVLTSPEPIVNAGPMPYLIKTLSGRTVWEGVSIEGPPRACGDWLLVPDGVISVSKGTRFAALNPRTANPHRCLGAGKNWIAMPDEMIVPGGASWRPPAGTLALVDGRLVNSIGGMSPVTAVYSPTEPEANPVPELTGVPSFTTTLDFTFGYLEGPLRETQLVGVSYSESTDQWHIGAEATIQVARSMLTQPAREMLVVSDDGETISRQQPAAKAAPCGPYSVATDADVSRVIVRRDDGGTVAVGPQPDPDHVVAANAQCVGYSDDYLALALRDAPGIVLLPLNNSVSALRLPDATGFTNGRPFSFDRQASTFTAYPPIAG